eukprot:EG_transcript_9690
MSCASSIDEIKRDLSKPSSDQRTKWNLARKRIDATGAEVVADFLTNSMVVQELMLDTNVIGFDGAHAISKALIVNSSLQKITLRMNSIMDEGCKAFANALRLNSSVKHICLARNGILDAGAQELAESLLFNSTLEEIDLSENNIGAVGIQALEKALEHNFKIKQLCLTVAVPDEHIAHIRELLDRNSRGTMGVAPRISTSPHSNPPAGPLPASTSTGLRGSLSAVGTMGVAPRISTSPHSSPPAVLPVALRPDAEGGTFRHAMGLEFPPDTLGPLLRGFTPVKGCAEYIVDCAVAYARIDPRTGSTRWFQEVIAIAKAYLQKKCIPEDNHDAFAIVCYTIDLQAYGATASQNFHSVLNQAMQRRDKSINKLWQGYLYYLLHGLENLPAMPRRTFYRGLPKDLLPTFEKEYTRGKHIIWSGFSSVSETIGVAYGFAKPGGIIVQVDSHSARSVKNLSVFPQEVEALLLPNFKALVTKELEKMEDGYWNLTLLEPVDTPPYVF